MLSFVTSPTGRFPDRCLFSRMAISLTGWARMSFIMMKGMLCNTGPLTYWPLLHLHKMHSTHCNSGSKTFISPCNSSYHPPHMCRENNNIPDSADCNVWQRSHAPPLSNTGSSEATRTRRRKRTWSRRKRKRRRRRITRRRRRSDIFRRSGQTWLRSVGRNRLGR